MKVDEEINLDMAAKADVKVSFAPCGDLAHIADKDNFERMVSLWESISPLSFPFSANFVQRQTSRLPEIRQHRN